MTKNFDVLANQVKGMEKLLKETIKSKDSQINDLEEKNVGFRKQVQRC